MKTLSKIIMMMFLVVMMSGCTANIRAKMYGGTYIERLPAGCKFVNATWKEANLWVLTRKMKPNEVPETYTMYESSAFGILQGTVIFVESK